MKDFKEIAKKELEMLGYIVKEQEIYKNNQKLVSLVVTEEENQRIAPTFYTDSVQKRVDNGEDINDVLADFINFVTKEISNPRIEEFDTSILKDSSNYVLAVLNKEKNKELLEKTPHKTVHDLAVFIKCSIADIDSSDDNISASTTLNEAMLKSLDISFEEAYEAARINTIAKSNLRNLGGIFPFMNDEDTPLYIFEAGEIGGASVIAVDECLEMVRKSFKEDFFILPSSRHEILCLPKSLGNDVFSLKMMVEEVNATAVAEDDFLSNNVYSYGEDGLAIENTSL